MSELYRFKEPKWEKGPRRGNHLCDCYIQTPFGYFDINKDDRGVWSFIQPRSHKTREFGTKRECQAAIVEVLRETFLFLAEPVAAPTEAEVGDAK